MKRKFSRVNMMVAAVALAVASFFLRLGQVAAAFDENGMVTGKGVVFFSLFSVAVTALFALYSYTLKKRKSYRAIAGQDLPVLAVSVGATMLMIGASAALLLRPTQAADRVVAIGGMMTGVCWGATAAGRYLGKKVHLSLFMIPAVYYVVVLVLRFRFWTRDPIIIDYCYDLFALISLMCASFHLGGFCMDEGHRRLTTFFNLCSVFFSAAALVQANKADALSYVAAILWMMSNLWLLLRPSREKAAVVLAELPDEEPEEAEEIEEDEEDEENEEMSDLP